MSVFMTLRAKGDPVLLEKHAANDPDYIHGISQQAKSYGLIGHRFYGSDDGEILVIDEWPDAASFHKFFEAMGDKIGPMMADIGAGEPEIKFWRLLDTHDEVGWTR